MSNPEPARPARRGPVTPGKVALAVLLVFLFAWPYMGPSEFMLYVASLAFIWAVVASYWNLLSGYSGILSLGNMGFFAVGAYVAAIFANEFGISPWLSIWIGGLVSMVIVTLILGLPALRLRGIYIALLTLVFALALPSIISLTSGVTGGSVGLIGLPTFLGDAGIERWQGYYITLVFAILALAYLYAIVRGRTGTAFVALRDSEDFASALGVDRYREGLKVFAISAFVTGVAGGVFTHILGQISPGMLGTDQFLMVIAMWMLGGVGTFSGPIIGAFVITFGNEYLRMAGSLRLALIGGLITITVLLFPGGIVELVRKAGKFASRHFQRGKGGADVA